MADKRQRRVNRYAKRFNFSLYNDGFLGIGRFQLINLYKAGRANYGERVYLFKFIDNNTGECTYGVVNDYNYARKLFWTMNNFIIETRKREGW